MASVISKSYLCNSLCCKSAAGQTFLALVAQTFPTHQTLVSHTQALTLQSLSFSFVRIIFFGVAQLFKQS